LLHLEYKPCETKKNPQVMDEETGIKDDHFERNEKEEVFTKVVRAGKRTYFFDVKTTRNEDLYLTITESKKRLGKEGKMFYEKHKIFLYREDFEKFCDGLREAVDFAESGAVPERVSYPVEESLASVEEVQETEFSNVDFEDLGTK
jgi:hypothetical protein